MWNKAVLYVIWEIQIPITVFHILWGSIPLARSSPKSWLTTRHAIEPLADLASLVLVLVEIWRYRSKRLQPQYYTISQSCRAIVATIAFGLYLPRQPKRLMSFESRVLFRVTWWQWFFLEAFVTLALYAGMLYGSIATYRDRMLHEHSFTGRHEANLLTPLKINSANNLQSQNHAVQSVVRWIYAPTLRENAGHGTCVKLVNMILVGLKWFPGILALILTLWVSPRCPSEPKNSFTAIKERPQLLDWDYIEPPTSQHRSYTDMPSQEELSAEITARSDFNRNSPMASGVREESVSLHQVDPVSLRPTTVGRSDSSHHTPVRLLGPRYLCVLDESHSRGYKTVSADDLRDMDSGDGILDYVFMSYTRRQFCTQIAGDPTLPSETNLTIQAAAERDTRTLLACAVAAAKSAHVRAFWIDFECVQPEGEERNEDSVEDVYRICDIVRAAHSLVIVTGPPLSRPNYDHDSSTTRTEWLKEWGSRLWTVPEALLAPTEHRIAIYTVGTDQPEIVAKRNLASRVWDDADSMRQLIDHYESSIHLAPLEHISIALECLQRRQTEQRMSGDVAYALMGLLRQRPKVDKHDSAFEAFARLLLANNSDSVLERLICLKPISQDARWYDMHDQWGVALREIHPLCEAIGLAGDDAVVLGSIRGAVINWSFLEPVDYAATSTRQQAWIYARTYPIVAVVGLIFLIAVDIGNLFARALIARMGVGIRPVYLSIYFLPALWVVVMGLLGSLVSPLLLRQLFRRKVRQTQARFFGVEGIPCLDKVEEIIFGSSRQRFSWKTDVEYEEPLWDESEDPERLRQFTLIDTLTLSATKFVAKRPPNAILACGRERGYVRSVLCSYDADSNTFCKEIAMRMDSAILNRMPEVDRIRFKMGSHA